MRTIPVRKKLTFAGMLYGFGGQTLTVPNISDAHALPGMDKNFDRASVEADREGSESLRFYNASPRHVYRGPDYLVEGADPDTTKGNGLSSDGRAFIFTETGQTDVTLELDCVVRDLSNIQIAVPDISNTEGTPVSSGGIWYIGPRSPSALCGPLMCIVPEEDGKPSLGIAVLFVSDFAGVNPVGGESTATTGRIVLLKLNDGKSDSQEVIATAPAPSPMPDEGDILSFRCTVTAGLLTVQVNDEPVYEDFVLPSDVISATKHGCFGQWEDAGIDANVGFAICPYTITCPDIVQLPRISVSGKDLIRLGRPFKSWGFQQTNYFHLVEYFNSTGQLARIQMAKEMRENREMGANTFRVHLDMWRFIEGASKDSLVMRPQQLGNFLYMLDVARQYQVYLLPCGGNVWQPEFAPSWYDELHYRDRWDVQEFFWKELVKAVVLSGNASAIIGYDLMNEPSVSADENAYWYGPDVFGIGVYYTAIIARGPDVDADTVGDWITQLGAAIKAIDPQALVTIGTLPYSTGYFGVSAIQGLIDFAQPHLYPPAEVWGETLAGQLAHVTGWAAATIPVICGETTPWSGVESNNITFFNALADSLQGIISFSYGYGPDDFTTPPDLPRPPAPADSDAGLYALQATALRFVNTYRNDFLYVSP